MKRPIEYCFACEAPTGKAGPGDDGDIAYGRLSACSACLLDWNGGQA